MRKPSSVLLIASLVVVSWCAAVAVARADDKPSPEGTWKWSFERGGQTIEMSVKLKLADGKLTGSFVGRDGMETPIKEGSFKDGTVSFQIVRERNDRKFMVKYQGKIDGNSLKGTTEFTGPDGQTRSRDWEAKREPTAGDLTGPWKVKLDTPMGEIERSMKLKQDGEKLTGTYTGMVGDMEIKMEIKEGKVKGAEFTFKIDGERDGQKFSFVYKGKRDGDKLKGTVDYDLAGNTGTIDFAGERAKDEPKKDEPKKDAPKSEAKEG